MWQLSGRKELPESRGFSRFISHYTQEKAPGKENLEKDRSFKVPRREGDQTQKRHRRRERSGTDLRGWSEAPKKSDKVILRKRNVIFPFALYDKKNPKSFSENGLGSERCAGL